MTLVVSDDFSKKHKIQTVHFVGPSGNQRIKFREKLEVDDPNVSLSESKEERTFFANGRASHQPWKYQFYTSQNLTKQIKIEKRGNCSSESL